MALAFTTVSAVLGQSTLRGAILPVPGLAVGLVGMDQISAGRATPAASRTLDGVEIVLVAVGLIAVAEVLYFALRGPRSGRRTDVARLHVQA
jgi:putative tricarboxylic transport membrane protein